ncbi:hypothetical protein AKO1_014695 [Acrasis kona]|uniref:EGF-like domain-containing protein n=1 Tax=Acrasis kona TaxID=1008807 RepID=A0AAW2Z0K0_9EUKA
MKYTILILCLVCCYSNCTAQGARGDYSHCYTCPPGHTHWFDAGYEFAPQGDRCACVAIHFRETDCDPCPSGHIHWFKSLDHVEAPGGDQCACVIAPAKIPFSSTLDYCEVNAKKRSFVSKTCINDFARQCNGNGRCGEFNNCTCKPGFSGVDCQIRCVERFPCFECKAGFVHWYDVENVDPPGGDKCGCVRDGYRKKSNVLSGRL